jgi:hypothetical protein
VEVPVSVPPKRSTFATFRHHFLEAVWGIRVIISGLFAWLVVDAVAIAYFEKMPFSDALYFAFITGLTIGYGDIAPVTPMGRVVAVLTGLLGMLITGLIVAVAVFAVRKAMEPPTDQEVG